MLAIPTANRWHMVTDSPIARGPEPLRSFLFLSHVAKTVNTKMKVIISSTPNACGLVSMGFGRVLPMGPLTSVAVSPYNMAEPMTAPTHCTSIYPTALTMLIFLVRSIPTVTAGLIWPPLTLAMDQAMVATLRPKHSDTCTMVGSLPSPHVVQEPQPINTNRQVPSSSANRAFQKPELFTSSRLPTMLKPPGPSGSRRRTPVHTEV